jgi:hypothetical protein
MALRLLKTSIGGAINVVSKILAITGSLIQVFRAGSPNPTPGRERDAQRIVPRITLFDNAEPKDPPRDTVLYRL